MAVISMVGDPPPAVAGAGEWAWLDVVTEDAWLELRRRERRPLADPLADLISCLLGQLRPRIKRRGVLTASLNVGSTSPYVGMASDRLHT